MRKFIHSNFEIDLSKLKITTQEENHWFSDSFFSKFSLPFEIDLDQNLDECFGFISFYNSTGIETVFNGKYFEHGEKFDAVLEIEEFEDKLICSIRFGMEDFPNFEKSLSELPLEDFAVDNIYDHAKTIIGKTWPEVNYNFPQIHIDKIDTEDDIWLAFEKIINNYKNGDFLRNEVDLVENISYNRNIMQPMPYLFHIFISGFADAGYDLRGDILNDEILKKMILYASVEYQTTFEQESYSIVQMSEDNQGVFISPMVYYPNHPLYVAAYSYTTYYYRQVISSPGRYRIIGKIKTARYFLTNIKRTITIKYRDRIIFEHNQLPPESLRSQSILTYNIDVTFETLSDLEEDYITIESRQGNSREKVIFELDINPIRLHDDNGEVIPSVVNPNKINLSRAVPDMKFGDLFTAFKNLFNYGIDIIGNEVHVNFIQNQIRAEQEIDLSSFEVKKPRRKFNKGMSFLMQYDTVESKDYKFLPAFQNSLGVSNSGFKKDEKTNEININALPLPLKVNNGVQTAHGFEDDKSKIYMLLYSGLRNGLNLALDPEPLSMPSVHARYSKEWFDRRINGQSFVWSFMSYYESIIGLKSKSKIFAYGLSHLIKTINREEVSENLYQIDIECESILK